jgi:hypothetical protein
LRCSVTSIGIPLVLYAPKASEKGNVVVQLDHGVELFSGCPSIGTLHPYGEGHSDEMHFRRIGWARSAEKDWRLEMVNETMKPFKL